MFAADHRRRVRLQAAAMLVAMLVGAATTVAGAADPGLPGEALAKTGPGSTSPATSLVARPLAPLSGPRGKTMFAQLPPEATGVRTENRYDDPRMKGELYQEFEGGSIGTGVAIGDYDGDGRPDIFVASKTESCRLFRNLGNFKFEDVTDKAGV
ncbi:MAG: VCBS repeat-containing protein, partial [Opitutus sp.]